MRGQAEGRGITSSRLARLLDDERGRHGRACVLQFGHELGHVGLAIGELAGRSRWALRLDDRLAVRRRPYGTGRTLGLRKRPAVRRRADRTLRALGFIDRLTIGRLAGES